jgi:two-component system response regulator
MILIVEDNEDDSRLLIRQLAKLGLEKHVQLIADGREALDYLLQVSPPPYAVFLDLRLPGLSGIELLREIRGEPRFHALPVLVMTSSIDPADAEMCARLGVCAYSPKPLSLELIRTIESCGDSQWTFLPRPIDPHLVDVASSMLYDGT